MKTKISQAVCFTVLALFVAAFSGCGAPPAPPKSAKNEIQAAEESMTSGAMLAKRNQYELAKNEYERALEEISKGEAFAGGTELARLRTLRGEARKAKIECESKAISIVRTKPAATAAPVGPAAVDPEVAKRNEEKKQAADLAAKSNEVLAAMNTKASKKQEEPEPAETGDKPKTGEAEGKEGKKGEAAAPAKPKIIDGIFPEITENSPPMQVLKLTRVGKFVVVYCQLYNKSDDQKRLNFATFFKDRDNQIVIDALRAAAFPYKGFSLKVKDLLADQQLNAYTSNSQVINGREGMQFVAVAEAVTEADANKIVKAYVSVSLGDGTNVEATGPEGGVDLQGPPKLKLK